MHAIFAEISVQLIVPCVMPGFSLISRVSLLVGHASQVISDCVYKHKSSSCFCFSFCFNCDNVSIMTAVATTGFSFAHPAYLCRLRWVPNGK